MQWSQYPGGTKPSIERNAEEIGFRAHDGAMPQTDWVAMQNYVSFAAGIKGTICDFKLNRNLPFRRIYIYLIPSSKGATTNVFTTLSFFLGGQSVLDLPVDVKDNVSNSIIRWRTVPHNVASASAQADSVMLHYSGSVVTLLPAKLFIAADRLVWSVSNNTYNAAAEFALGVFSSNGQAL